MARRRPGRSQELLAQAISLHQAGALEEAEKLYSRILANRPDDFDARHLLGVIRQQQGRSREAAELIAAALVDNPRSSRALSNYGLVLADLDQPDQALAALDRALAIDAAAADIHNNRVHVLLRLSRPDEALACFDQALRRDPGYPEAHNNRGNALQAMRRFDDALAAYDHALSLRASYAQAHFNRGSALRQLKRDAEALTAFDTALALRPDYPEALFSRGDALSQLKRYEEAIDSYERAVALWPDHPHAFNGLADAALAACDWSRIEALTTKLVAAVKAGSAVVSPFTLLRIADDPALHRQAARRFAADRARAPRPVLREPGRWTHERIRIAYLSADFHSHATAYLIAELIEQHDRARFEIVGISFGPDDGSAIRQRLIAAFDRFIDVRTRSDRDIAALIAALRIDIAVDLKGYTMDSRPDILSFRPAPVQVQWLGYPGTLGTDFIDYVIGDGIVTPPAHAPFYDEKIVALPNSYQVNDRKRTIAARTPARRELELPEHGIVFCCFNNSFKILPAMFALWMRLLARVPGSVLWLLQDNAVAERNLRGAAAAHGIEPARLVFAGRVNLEQHLARHRAADLFLDTLPYNAHTTASDALWSGLPVLTCRGEAFAGRVAASLLQGVGLPELVTENLADYESLAYRLAGHPDELQALRRRLETALPHCALFDTDRFRRAIEAAYSAMYEAWQRGETPRALAIPDR